MSMFNFDAFNPFHLSALAAAWAALFGLPRWNGGPPLSDLRAALHPPPEPASGG